VGECDGIGTVYSEVTCRQERTSNIEPERVTLSIVSRGGLLLREDFRNRRSEVLVSWPRHKKIVRV